MRSDVLVSLVKKFNKKMTVSALVRDHKRPTFTFDEIENETNAMEVDITEAIGKTHDNWLDTNNLNDMFAEQVRIDNK